MFAVFVQEREPLKLEDLPAMLETWVLVVGSFAALGLVLWVLLLRRLGPGWRERPGSWPRRILSILVGGGVLLVAPAVLQILWNYLGWVNPASPPRGPWSQPLRDLAARPRLNLLEAYGAACALAAVLLPVFGGLGHVRGRRVWAMAKLSLKESVRRRVLWGFSLMLLVFLFGSWFLPYKPEDQVRNYVRAVFLAMTMLLLVTAGLLAAFSIPSDIKSLSIHTIVTKPVERFEILVGRYFGYILLMTVVLVVMSLLSLGYVARGVDQEAAEESLKARVPIYGNLIVTNPKNVGYEWDYRQYITGASDDEATWTFHRLPAHLAERPDTVRCEFTFDIFRTTKGEENRGVLCTFLFKNPQFKGAATAGGLLDPATREQYQAERDRVLAEPDPEIMKRAQLEGWPQEKRLAVLCNGLAEKYGFYELPSREVVDFHTLYVDVPAGLFRHLKDRDPRDPAPPLQVVVRCDSPTQYVGVAKHDLYLLDAERSFAVNFFKGGAGGLWMQLCLIAGLAIVLSTYLSGIISFFAAVVIFVLGYFIDFIRTVAEGKAMGGGTFENGIRMLTNAHTAMALDRTPMVILAQNADKYVSQNAMALVLHLIPDVDRLDFTRHVAEGFDVGASQLAITVIFLAGYLVPWMILGYYLMRSREVAA